MPSPRIVIYFGIAVLAISRLMAQQDAALPDPTQILSEIDAIENKQKEGAIAAKASTLRSLQAAANGTAAVGFYEQAVEDVFFEGKKGKTAAFIDWKKQKSDMLRSNELQDALRLHLTYLKLAIQRKGMEKPETMIPAIMSYLQELLALDDKLQAAGGAPDEVRDLLEKPLSESLFVKWLSLRPMLPEDKEWEPRPNSVAGILNTNIRPLLRAQKSPALLETWDLQLKVEAERTTRRSLQLENEQFNTQARPRLLFNKAQDMVVLGMPNRAMTEMLNLAKTYPNHPDVPQWISRIRELVPKPAPAATTSQPAPPQGTSPQ